MSLRSRFRIFAIDARSLALFRIAIASILLTDIWIRSGDLVAMYSAEGMMPPGEVWRLLQGTGRWSVHLVVGSAAMQAALFAAAAAFGAALFVGYRTRIATIGSWFLLTSLQNRSPLLGSGGDELLRLLLFWSMFLPLGRSISVDAARAGGPDDRPVCSGASAAILLQVCAVYAFSGLLKLNEDWLSGEAVRQVLSVSWFSRPTGRFLEGAGLTTFMTWATLGLEIGAPFLLLSPWRTAGARLVAITLLTVLHLGIDVTMRVGWFSYISFAGLLLFAPGAVWDRRFSPSRAATSVSAADGRVASWICTLLFGFVFLWNLSTLPALRWPDRLLVPPLRTFAQATGLAQKWGMFAHPPREDVWYVAYGELADGAAVDVFTGARPDPTKPRWTSERLPNQNWRHFLWRINASEYQAFRKPAAAYLCRSWNETHGVNRQVTKLKLIAYSARQSSTAAPSPKTTLFPYVRWSVDVRCGGSS